MRRKRIFKYISISCFALVVTACVPSIVNKKENNTVPASFGNNSQDTTNSGNIVWQQFFTDPYLKSLIDSAISNNQERNIMLQEIRIAQNEVRARKGAYLPFVNYLGGAGLDKVGTYTRFGALEKNLPVAPGKKFPEPFTDYLLSGNMSWQLDVWKQLRNARKSAYMRFLSTTNGVNFMKTNLVAEIANSYYELMALDNQLEIIKKNLEIQMDALEIVRLEKTAGRVTELAVRRFEAEVAKNQSRQYYIMQQIVVAENRINFLVGRFPQHIDRNSQDFPNLVPTTIQAGIPSQLLSNRPDIIQAEQELAASKLDVKVARADFYPIVNITAGFGYNAFNPSYFLNTPESMLYNLAGSFVGPLINRNAIKARYYSANARQIQAVYNYERSLLNAHIEVVNQLSNIGNLEKSYGLKDKQVQALNQSITISAGLFKSARADYMEVLLTQRDAMESKFELIETKKQQMNAVVNIYQALGGGWR